jgi:hypothetical protein
MRLYSFHITLLPSPVDFPSNYHECVGSRIGLESVKSVRRGYRTLTQTSVSVLGVMMINLQERFSELLIREILLAKPQNKTESISYKEGSEPE